MGAVALFNLVGLDLSFFSEFSLGGRWELQSRSYTVYRSTKDVSEMTVKASYHSFLECSFNQPHCIEKWRPVYGPLYWEATWKQFYFSRFLRSATDLSWKVAHNVVFTLDCLVRCGYSNLKNYYCGTATESLEHLFYSCPLAQSVLGLVSLLFFTAVPDCPSLRPRHILFGFNADELARIPMIFPVILIIYKWSIWLAQNDFHFRYQASCVKDVIASIKVNLSFCIRCHFRASGGSFNSFLKHWCANGFLASVEIDRLSFKM